MPDFRAIQTWFLQALSEREDLVVEAHLFGSALAGFDNISDVDVVLIFNVWNVRNECTSIKQDFRQAFGLPLHVQMFHRSQVSEIREFLDEAAETRRVL